MSKRVLITPEFSSILSLYVQGRYDGVASSLESEREILEKARAESEHVRAFVDTTAMHALNRAIEVAKEGRKSKDFEIFYLYLAYAMEKSDTTPVTSP